jgi:hypothetical protein
MIIVLCLFILLFFHFFIIIKKKYEIKKYLFSNCLEKILIHTYIFKVIIVKINI